MARTGVVEEAEPPSEARPSLLRRATAFGSLGPWAALLLAAFFFTFRSDRFLTGDNLSLIVQQVMVVGTLGVGQTLIILTRGIDLSNGAVMSFGSIVMTKLAVDSGINPIAAIALRSRCSAAFRFVTV